MVTIEQLYQTFVAHPVITTDSRQIKKDSMFFALKGDRFDGNAYALEALHKGCACAVIDRREIFNPADPRLILVDDVLATLQNLALYHRERLSVSVLAITGTNGKTTTKELVARILEKRWKVDFTKGNFNNHIGVPLTLLSADKETEVLVVEMGANHPGEIEALCRIARPTAGLITNIGKAHLEGFGTIEQIARTKAELYQFLRSNNGHIFLNTDHAILQSLIRPGDQTITYGVGTMVDYRFSPPGSDLFLDFRWYHNGAWKRIHTSIYGKYNVENAMAAIAVGGWFGVDADQIVEAVESYQPENARSQIIDTGKNRVILDAYNANPSSVELAIREFNAVEAKHKAVILGDMFELGKEEAAEHERIWELLKKECLEEVKIFLVGQAYHRLTSSSPYIHLPGTDEARQYFNAHPLSGHTILIKGSRGMTLEKLLPLF